MMILLRVWGFWTTGAASEEGEGGRLIHPILLASPVNIT